MKQSEKEKLIGKLDFDYGEALTVEEFVLVPDAGMCIHVPPPPPNQMIFVKLKKPEKVRYMFQPIAIEGVLKKTLPIEMPYMPPTREFLIYISTECA